MDSVNQNFEQQLNHLIQKMKIDYGLFIGEKSLQRLSFFLRGYMYAFFEENGYIFAFDKDFQAYIQNKTHFNEVLHWDTILQSGRTDEEAFDEFFIQYDHFLGNTADGSLCSP